MRQFAFTNSFSTICFIIISAYLAATKLSHTLFHTNIKYNSEPYSYCGFILYKIKIFV